MPPAPSARRNARSRRRGGLERAAADGADYILFLEDDLEFNAHLRHNLEHWQPLRAAGPDEHLMASLYDPGSPPSGGISSTRSRSPTPNGLRQPGVPAVARHRRDRPLRMEQVPGMQDIKISRLAAAAGPIHYHRPSLVQHAESPAPGAGTTTGPATTPPTGARRPTPMFATANPRMSA